MSKQQSANKIKAFRQKRGWTRHELSLKFKNPIHQDLIYKWETDRSNPSAQNLLELAEIFEVDPRELLSV